MSLIISVIIPLVFVLVVKVVLVIKEYLYIVIWNFIVFLVKHRFHLIWIRILSPISFGTSRVCFSLVIQYGWVSCKNRRISFEPELECSYCNAKQSTRIWLVCFIICMYVYVWIYVSFFYYYFSMWNMCWVTSLVKAWCLYIYIYTYSINVEIHRRLLLSFTLHCSGLIVFCFLFLSSTVQLSSRPFLWSASQHGWLATSLIKSGFKWMTRWVQFQCQHVHGVYRRIGFSSCCCGMLGSFRT